MFGIDEITFDKLMLSIGANGVGKSFFVYKWRDFDISLPRVETKISTGHRGFKVEVAKSEREASFRRDFTMNALMYNIYTHEILDFYGGISDIKAKKIKIIDEQKFKEDSLRVFRAMQFSSRFKLKIEKNSIRVMQSIDLNDLSSERIWIEFFKMFKSKYLHYGLFYMFKLQISKKIFDLDITFREFLKISKEFIKYRDSFNSEIYEYYFLYILSSELNVSKTFFTKKLKLDRIQKKFFKFLDSQIKIPKSFNYRFILTISLKRELENWLGSYRFLDDFKQLDIYLNRLDTEVKSIDVINDGFVKEQISKEIKKREFTFIKKLDKNLKKYSKL